MITQADIGVRVRDRAGNVGILADLVPDCVDPEVLPQDRRPHAVAFLRPERGGGREWLVSPKEVSRA